MWLMYGIYLAAFILFTVLVESELFGWTTTYMIIAGVLYTWLAKLPVLSLVKEHYQLYLEIFACYMAIGVAWSFIRWFLFLMKFKFKFKEAKESYLIRIGSPSLTEVPKDKKDDFDNHLLCLNVDGQSLRRRPQASDSKRRITGWMCFWPGSMVGYVLNDPVRKLFNAIFSLLKNSYQKMADALLNDPDLK